MDSQIEINDFEYDFLTGSWEGPYGAAYMATYEWCKNNGLCDQQGRITRWGLEAVKKFEKTLDKVV